MSEKTVDERIELQGWTGRIEPRAALLTVMAIGTVLLAGLLFYVMLKQPFERWSGPYQSPMGWHVVRRRRPENPTFEEMRLKVRSEILAQRAGNTPESTFENLRKRYEVEMADIPDVQK